MEGLGNRYLLCNVNGFKVTDQVVEDLWVENEFKVGAILYSNNTRKLSITPSGEQTICNPEVLKHIFKLIDRDSSGKVARGELLSACSDEHVRLALDTSFPTCKLDLLFKNLD